MTNGSQDNPRSGRAAVIGAALASLFAQRKIGRPMRGGRHFVPCTGTPVYDDGYTRDLGAFAHHSAAASPIGSTRWKIAP